MLCKCSGKYIDIYFILKITYYKNFIFFDSPIMFHTKDTTIFMDRFVSLKSKHCYGSLTLHFSLYRYDVNHMLWIELIIIYYYFFFFFFMTVYLQRPAVRELHHWDPGILV